METCWCTVVTQCMEYPKLCCSDTPLCVVATHATRTCILHNSSFCWMWFPLHLFLHIHAHTATSLPMLGYIQPTELKQLSHITWCLGVWECVNPALKALLTSTLFLFITSFLITQWCVHHASCWTLTLLLLHSLGFSFRVCVSPSLFWRYNKASTILCYLFISRSRMEPGLINHKDCA